MSIADAIATKQQQIRDSYTAVSNKGGTLPSVQNLTNLSSAISSIPTGGITPTDTIFIDRNGTYDVTDCAEAVVNVPTQDEPLFQTIITSIPASYPTNLQDAKVLFPNHNRFSIKRFGVSYSGDSQVRFPLVLTSFIGKDTISSTSWLVPIYILSSRENGKILV